MSLSAAQQVSLEEKSIRQRVGVVGRNRPEADRSVQRNRAGHPGKRVQAHGVVAEILRHGYRFYAQASADAAPLPFGFDVHPLQLANAFAQITNTGNANDIEAVHDEKRTPCSFGP